MRPNVPVWARDCWGQIGYINWGMMEESVLRCTAGEMQKCRRLLCTSVHVTCSANTCSSISHFMLSLWSQKLQAAFTLSQNKASQQRQLSRRSDGWFSGQQSPLDKQFLCYCLNIINCPMRRPEMRFLQMQGMQARTSSCCFLVNKDRERWHLVKRRVRDGNG